MIIALLQTTGENVMQVTKTSVCSSLLGDQDEEPFSTRGK
jgi:hypothetical protein